MTASAFSYSSGLTIGKFLVIIKNTYKYIQKPLRSPMSIFSKSQRDLEKCEAGVGE